MQLKPGDIVTIEKMEKHSFSTKSGVVFEEISTTAFSNDSVYTDEKINKIAKRKTSLSKTKLLKGIIGWIIKWMFYTNKEIVVFDFDGVFTGAKSLAATKSSFETKMVEASR